MTSAMAIKPSILNIRPYVGGDKNPPGVTRLIGLSSNENPLGAPPSAMAAIQGVLSKLNTYPNGSSDDLRAALGQKHNIHQEQIICGNGSEELLHLIVRGFTGVGDEVIFSQYGFQLYDIATHATGATPVKAPAPQLTIDVDAILNSVTPKTKVVLIDNPANPVGSVLFRNEIERLHKALPANVILVLDSAYAEYLRDDRYEDGINLVKKYQNVIMTRTFSKFYGLAGARIGWCYGSPEIISALQRIRPPFSVNILAQVAGMAMVNDSAYAQLSYETNQAAKESFTRNLENLNIEYIPSYTNFVLIKTDAQKTFNALASKGIITRLVANYGLPDWLRISIGTIEQMDKVSAVLKDLN